MPVPQGSTPDDSSSGEATITALLGEDLATETTDQGAGDTPLGGQEPVVEEEPGSPEGEEGATDEPTQGPEDGSAEGAEGEGGDAEEDFEAEAPELDYAETAYQRAAAHWDKRGVKLDPADPGQRALLKELMDRGQKIRELSTREQEPEKKDDEQPPVAAAPAAAKSPQEQFKETLTNARAYSKEIFNPEAAKEVMLPVAQAFAKFFWGKDAEKFNLGSRSVEDLREFTEALDTAMTIKMVEAIPSIVGAIPNAMGKQFPMLPRIHESAEREAAAEELVTAADASGNALFPGIDRLIENGTIKRLMNGPELKDAVFSPDRQKNFVAKAKAAYKMARGEAVDPKVLAKAVARGRDSANQRARAVAAGRTPAGSSNRGFANPAAISLKEQILGGGKPGFSGLLKDVRSNRE